MLTEIVSDVRAETLAVTASGGWREGDRVNLERQLCVGDELGGHLVSDHVDGVADILEIDQMAALRGAADQGGWSRSSPDGEMTKAQTPRWGWALTGSGHYVRESLALIHDLEHVDLFVSKAGAEVLRMYRQELELSRSTRIYRDTSASSVTVGHFYYGDYHTLIAAPATSNAVAKFVYGISDDLVSNVFAHGGKCRVPAIVFACDTAPELETEAPKGIVKVYPRPIDLENREKLGRFAGATTVDSIAELREAIVRRRSKIALNMNSSSMSLR